MRRNRLYIAATSVLAALGLSIGLVASSASASTVNLPPRHHAQACAWNLNGRNILELTFQGGTFDYPVYLHVGDNGLISGILFDKNLPVGSQYLRVNGLCIRDNVILDSNYPVVDPQGSRAEDMVVTPITNHPFFGKVSGDWTETGTEQGSGLASLVHVVHRNI